MMEGRIDGLRLKEKMTDICFGCLLWEVWGIREFVRGFMEIQ